MPVPNQTKREFIDQYLSSATIRLLLLEDSTSYTFDPDAHDFVDDVLAVATEFSGTGYGRKTLSNVTISANDTNDVGSLDADNVTFADINGATIQTIVIYEQVGGDDTTPADDRVLFVIDDADTSELPFPTNGSDVTINWDSLGIYAIE